MSETTTSAVPSEVAERLAGKSGRKYWRSLDELTHDAEFSARLTEHVRKEYPSQVEMLADPVQRRTFLQLMGASLALAGISSCTRQPDEHILPFAKTPENVIPGKPLYFATSMPWASGAIGLLVESHMGRPTKIEGNPEHKTSRGSTDLFAQASVLELYDPDRSTTSLRNGRMTTWDALVAELMPNLEAQKLKGGAGLRILSRTFNSPTLALQMGELLKQFPKARWVQCEAVNRDNQRQGALMSFAEDVAPRIDLQRADVIVALECDLLADGPSSVRHARDWADRRRSPAGMNRMYAVESTPTCTGSMADHRLALAPSGIDRVARAIAQAVGVDVGTAGGAQLGGEEANFVTALVKDLKAQAGKSVVVAGEALSPQVHALVNAINVKLGNVGTALSYGEPAAPVSVEQLAALKQLSGEMLRGEVEILVILDANPVYDAPADFEFVAAMQKVAQRVHYGQQEDETGVLCHWHVPASHFLESWSDARSFDGSLSIVQPLIAPLYATKSAHEFVAMLSGKAGAPGYDIVRDAWKTRMGEPADFEARWQRALHDGFLADSALRSRDVSLKKFDAGAAPVTPSGELELALRPDSCVYDGRFGNNGWLQEVPRPASKLVWDNALYLSPQTAAELKVETGAIVELTHAGRKLKVAVCLLPGQARGTATLHLGYGRTRAGKLGTGPGFNAYSLRNSNAPWGGPATLARSGETYMLACAQGHHDINEGVPHGFERDLVRETTAVAFAQGDYGAPQAHAAAQPAEEHAGGHGAKPAHADGALITQYPAYKYEGYAWGMVIDLSTCLGCNACVVACQAENNIPIVGKEQVARGRELHWIRIDRYFTGQASSARLVFQPIVCMQCENAPCEVVCPVGATSHGPEGLNDMVYNRCIGTKYCSNNCPYKVRRFNFLLYSDWTTPSLKLQRNPDVSVRSRGVMEKCTYCVQRISQARIEAKREDRSIRDGEVVTACQQVCPAQAITFGDLNDKSSIVHKQHAQPHNYGLLTELNTAPRTTYLSRVSNPNPDIRQVAGS
jgi:molybdopterin-containing oxidoreductase family iron-sulfur binding subunit